MVGRFGWLCGLLLLLASVSSAEETERRREPLVFSGNVVLSDELYLAVLDLPIGFVASSAEAERVRDRLLSFLLQAGYELARVDAVLQGDRIFVDIDEGRVEKVILRGQGSLRTVQLIIGLGLPHNVFNRPYLKRQFAELREHNGVEVDHYELVRRDDVTHLGPQVKNLEPIPLIDTRSWSTNHPLLPPRDDYQLHVVFHRREWVPGLGVYAGLSGVDGLRLGVEYKGENLLLSTDRWRASTQLGTKIRTDVVDEHDYLALTRASSEVQWLAPRLHLGIRPALAFKGEFTSRQRPDVGLESYFATRAQLALGLIYDLLPGTILALGLGAEKFDVFSLRRVEGSGAIEGIEPSSTFQPFLGATAQVTFDTDEIRRDRRHEIEVVGRYSPDSTGRSYGLLTYRYQKVCEIGWHDVWVTSRGAFLWGKMPFTEEQPVGGPHVRGVFDDRFYTRNVVSTGLEARFSLIRDLYKVGLFTDVAVFGQRELAQGTEKARIVGGLGPSVHLLLADTFQFDLYYSVGLARGGEVDSGFSAVLKQAF
ncbi:hypothetical protein [Stigmatella aurantiaca]|uniref:Uncharacterized protein n=1 Tax=Stigmatella aurantiaca (strain DW4/3-1) TaxID=378806 RepID=Q09AW3_STIAD|nr:hypothetical protein [Stigmatella aurantiaca]ADO72413.1 uncharacterized protein STAUR_4633 [Stigmatella aurantiaca DW4/3-1]EAU68920.1 hypothetical protein STIAU_6885 [Stigmatella aurantiaca DW4/3-1]